jgi:heme-degrading monooxygenase HmoA
MIQPVYTLGVWRVKPGYEEEFIAAWKTLGAIFSQLPAPPIGKGTLLQSMTEPTLFYSFGPWRSLEDIQSMRQDSHAQAEIERLRELCSEAIPGSFQVVAES